MEPSSSINLNQEGRALFAANRAVLERKLNIHWREHWSSDARVEDVYGLISDLRLIWADQTVGSTEVVLANDHVVIHLDQYRGSGLSCSIFAISHAQIDQRRHQLKEVLPLTEPKPQLLETTFWYHTAHGPKNYVRNLEVPTWQGIEDNYPRDTRNMVQQLLNVNASEVDVSGKLVLWQGVPGTGKTYALRALGNHWTTWCRIHYILDPEKFFTHGDYLIEVIMGGELSSHWRLIVLEDAGELIAKDAKQQVGAGLAKLLNLTSGLLGQGLRVLVLITTNEEVKSLNDAVTRHGRCINKTEFQHFDSDEATRWLKQHGSNGLSSAGRMTLANLYHLLEHATEEVKAPSYPFGFNGLLPHSRR